MPASSAKLPLNSFGELLLEVPAQYPALRQWLPQMPADEVQRNWTGSCGKPLLAQSCDFVQSLEQACQQYQGHSIQGRVLDYGCGWGRIMRLMLAYVAPEQLYGLDPWDTSIDLCHEHNCMGQLAVCDYVPQSLPFDGPFDLMYAYSVFTHLSEKTAGAVMQVLRKYVSENGLLAITIRPKEYWQVHQGWPDGFSKEEVLRHHDSEGYGFIPHQREPIDGDITYGDTSMTLDYIRSHWHGWKVVGTQPLKADPLQHLVFLQPA